MTARIARKGIESRDRLGRHRWAVERTHAWFASFGKLRIRFERGWTAMLRSFRWQLPSSAHVSWMTCVSDKKNGFTLNVNPFFLAGGNAQAICVVRAGNQSGLIKSRGYFRLFRLWDRSSARTKRAGFRTGF